MSMYSSRNESYSIRIHWETMMTVLKWIKNESLNVLCLLLIGDMKIYGRFRKKTTKMSHRLISIKMTAYKFIWPIYRTCFCCFVDIDKVYTIYKGIAFESIVYGALILYLFIDIQSCNESLSFLQPFSYYLGEKHTYKILFTPYNVTFY